MYDILTNIFKHPGNNFSSLPIWHLNPADSEEALRQLSEFHIKGVHGAVICPPCACTSEDTLTLLERIAASAAKRRMLLVLSDTADDAQSLVVQANPLFASRCIFAVPTGSHTPAPGEELLLTFTEAEEAYDCILGFRPSTSDAKMDLLNPDAVDALIENTYVKYHARLGSYFGTTIIGFRNTVRESMASEEDGVRGWSYDLLDDFLAEGGDDAHLAALLLPSADKRKKRDAENIYRHAIRRRMASAYYGKLSDWCQKHGVAFMGHPASTSDCDVMNFFDVPGQRLTGNSIPQGEALSAADSVAAKCASDAARHMGASRAAAECFGTSAPAATALSPCDMMRTLNFLFARGINMIHQNGFCSAPTPHDVGMYHILWENYKPFADYITRMSWLNAMNDNNPCCAVLCSSDFVPIKAVAGLYENGYTFNYLTMNDVMHRSRTHDGKLCVDRYQYDVLLIDNRLRLDPASVLKLGRMVTEGGKIYRGNDFLSFVKKNVKKTSYFASAKKEDSGLKHIRFVHLTKSGYPFFLCFNEGTEPVSGYVVTDQSGFCNRFDPFTGDICEWKGELCPEGIRYPVTLEPNTVAILGLNTDVLPNLGKNQEKTVTEIIALSNKDGAPASFTYSPSECTGCKLTFAGVTEAVRVFVNDQKAGFLAYEPWELDITALLIDGENTVTVESLGEARATIHCAAEIFTK